MAWGVLSSISHQVNISGKDLIAYSETEALENNEVSCAYTMVETPLKLVQIPEERIASIVKWSHNDRYLAYKFGKIYLDATPQAVFIWDCISLTVKAV